MIHFMMCQVFGSDPLELGGSTPARRIRLEALLGGFSRCGRKAFKLVTPAPWDLAKFPHHHMDTIDMMYGVNPR